MGRPKREINAERGKRLKALIDDLGMTQIEFGKQINLSQQVISNIIQGKAHLTDERAKEIISIFPQYNLNWLIGNDSPMKKADNEQHAISYISSVYQHEHNLYSAMLFLIHDMGYDVELDNRLTITIPALNKTVVLSESEARSYYEELYNMIENYVNFHFNRHKKERL